MLVGGNAADDSIPEIHDQLAAIKDHARWEWKGMQKTTEGDALWSDVASPTASNQITTGRSRLRDIGSGLGNAGTEALWRCHTAGLHPEWNGVDGAVPLQQEREEYGNWWDWEIGTPLAIDDLLVLLYDKLTPEEVGVGRDRPVCARSPDARKNAFNSRESRVGMPGRGAAARSWAKTRQSCSSPSMGWFRFCNMSRRAMDFMTTVRSFSIPVTPTREASIGTEGSHVPNNRLTRDQATYMPDTVPPVNRSRRKLVPQSSNKPRFWYRLNSFRHEKR